MVQRQIEILPEKADLIARATTIVVAKIANAIAKKDRCTIALAGGGTPQPLYESLATQNLPWEKIHFFWGDERYVPYDHPQSNQLMARQALLDRVPIPPQNIHPMPTDGSSTEADAASYESELRDFFQSESSQFPQFDLVLLGIGDDGHTASLFPHTEVLQERTKAIAVGNKSGQPRLTFTVSLINQANCVLFLVAGESKSEVLPKILTTSSETSIDNNAADFSYPARLVRPQGELLWLLDRAAASNIPDYQLSTVS